MISSAAAHLRHDALELAGVVTRVSDLIGIAEMRSGRWFHVLAEDYLRERDKKRSHEASAALSDEERNAQANTMIQRACGLLSLTGACSGAAFTTASVSAAESAGLVGVIAFPLAGLVAGAEMMFRTLVHLRLSADLAELYGVKLGPEGTEGLLRMFALALNLVELVGQQDSGRDLVARVTHMEAGEVGKSIGRQLGSETLLRNVVPFLDIGIAAFVNVRLTARLGRFVRDYFAHRRAFDAPFAALEHRNPTSVPALVQGIWDMFLVDGHLTEHQAMVLSELVTRHQDRHGSKRALGRASEEEMLVDAFVPQHGDWMMQLKKQLTDPKSRALCLHLLEVAAALGGEVSEAETKLVQKVADVLHQPFDPKTLDDMAHGFATQPLLRFH